ncbi:hypothetical protein HYN56_19770 [Flavobacterium crocinum]|uniref:Uncharacterized protein n=1 Tax=Flavobacterium crocinum TaxID=2183896 RepID=A0A2S1YQR1_9FLAO|nr:hypothetical protein HYN56_19770 [Flavobacterium crocinum]
MEDITINAFIVSFLVWQIFNLATLAGIIYLLYRLYKKIKKNYLLIDSKPRMTFEVFLFFQFKVDYFWKYITD